MDPRGIPTFSEGAEKKIVFEEEHGLRQNSPVLSSGYSVSGVQYVEQARGGTSAHSVHLLKHPSSYSSLDPPMSFTEASGTKRMRRSVSNNSNVSRVSNNSTKTPTSVQPVQDPSRTTQNAQNTQIPTFTEQYWNGTESTPSTPGCNSTSTSTEEERNGFERIPPSFSLHKELEEPDETQPMYHTKTVRHRREKDWRYRMYYFSVLCSGLLVCVLIVMVSIYADLVPEKIQLEISPEGVAFKLEVPQWLSPGPMLIKFAPNTFGDESGRVMIESRDVPTNVSNLFAATTKVHGADAPPHKMLWIECNAQPQQAMDLLLPAPPVGDGLKEYEAFSLFEVQNGWGKKHKMTFKEFEVLERRFQPGGLLDVTLPLSAFSALKTQQGPEKWVAMILLATLPGVKRNISSTANDLCITIVCPIEGNECDKDLSFRRIDEVRFQDNRRPNLGATYVSKPGAVVNGDEGSTVFFYKDDQTGTIGVVITKPSGLRIQYVGLKEHNEEFDMGTPIQLPESSRPVLGTLPEDDEKEALLVVEVYPPRAYLEARNYPKQRVEPCLSTGDVIRRDFEIEVSDAGIINDDDFDLFWDGALLTPEVLDTGTSVYTFSEITDVLHSLRLSAKRKPNTPVYDKKATFYIKLTNLKFFDTNEFEDVEVLNERERRGWFDADSDITFRVEIGINLS